MYGRFQTSSYPVGGSNTEWTGRFYSGSITRISRYSVDVHFWHDIAVFLFKCISGVLFHFFFCLIFCYRFYLKPPFSEQGISLKQIKFHITFFLPIFYLIQDKQKVICFPKKMLNRIQTILFFKTSLNLRISFLSISQHCHRVMNTTAI